jgi:hypothetical protein
MIRFLADENFRRPIVDGVRLRAPAADILTVQEAGLDGTPDPDLLAWAAVNDRVVLTHDVQTVVGFAWDRVRAGLPMRGLGVVLSDSPVGPVVVDLENIARFGHPADRQDQVKYLPLP